MNLRSVPVHTEVKRETKQRCLLQPTRKGVRSIKKGLCSNLLRSPSTQRQTVSGHDKHCSEELTQHRISPSFAMHHMTTSTLTYIIIAVQYSTYTRANNRDTLQPVLIIKIKRVLFELGAIQSQLHLYHPLMRDKSEALIKERWRESRSKGFRCQACKGAKDNVVGAICWPYVHSHILFTVTMGMGAHQGEQSMVMDVSR